MVATTSPMSSGSPIFPRGMAASLAFRKFSLSKMWRLPAEWTQPGAQLLTRTPYSAMLPARQRMAPSRPNLMLEYTAWLMRGLKPLMEVMTTMLPER